MIDRTKLKSIIKIQKGGEIMNKSTSFIYIILICCFLVINTNEVLGKDNKPGLILEIELTAKAEQEAKIIMEKIREKKIKELQKANIKYNKALLNRLVKKEYVNSLTLRDFMDKITPKSREWFKTFFNNFKPDYISDFDTFYQKNKNLTLKEIKALHFDADTLKSKSKKATRPRTQLLTPTPQTPGPYFQNITGSKMIRKDNYNGQLRYLISTSNQSLYFRGRYNYSAYPYFPDYGNIYCGKCCGPAAGQSILEWFNVPVNLPTGAPLTSSYDIQERLADLMDTTDGPDYTHPDDLATTLMRNEFVGTKGFCYLPGDGTFNHLHYMLSIGTPVIMLLAEKKWAHWITVYGYNDNNGTYFVANDEDYEKSRLNDLWNFSNTYWYVDAAFAAVNVNPNTLFSYCSTGCDRDWDYILTHDPSEVFSPADRDELYYDEFINDYVQFHNEDGMKLNFYGYYTIQLLPILPLTKVSAGNQTINIYDENRNIISYQTPPSTSIRDNSIGQNVPIEVWVDKNFLDTYENLHCGFIVKDENDSILSEHYGSFHNYIDVAASNSNANNYVFKYTEPYQMNHKKVEFVIHDGFRRTSWTLGGCIFDPDNDGICFEYDNDDDNDGIIDSNDNCPDDENPDQVDNDENGVGFVCDSHEQCLIDCDPDYFENPSEASLCDERCDISNLIPIIPVIDTTWIKFLKCKWWDRIRHLDPYGPKFTESVAFNRLYQEYYRKMLNPIFGIVNDEEGKKMLLDLIKERYK